MHSSRVIVRSPYVCRVVRPAVCGRSMSIFPATQHLPRFPNSNFPGISHEIAPLLRLMDDFTASSRSFDFLFQPSTRQLVPFQPRFDVREGDEAYELRGEVPGVDSDALHVEFTDAQTLVIRGSTETEGTTDGRHKQYPQSAAVEVSESAATVENSDAASMHSSPSYQKATVEDEESVEASTASPAYPTNSESSAHATQQGASDSAPKSANTSTPHSNGKSYGPQSPYWISERTTGSFQRMFNFPSRINQEGVKASLKNGILNINIPKAAAQTIRRINVE